VWSIAETPYSLRGLFVSQCIVRLTRSKNKDRVLARTNYSFEKRQKELARKKKKEEKRLRKQGNNSNSDGEKETISPQEE